MDDACEREPDQRRRCRAAELAQVLGRERRADEDDERNEELEERREVRIRYSLDGAPVQRLEDAEAQARRRGEQWACHVRASEWPTATPPFRPAEPPKKRSAISALLSTSAALSAISTRPLSMTTPRVASRRPIRTFCSTRRIVFPASRIRLIESLTYESAFGSRPSDGSSRSTIAGSSISVRANSTMRRC